MNSARRGRGGEKLQARSETFDWWLRLQDWEMAASLLSNGDGSEYGWESLSPEQVLRLNIHLMPRGLVALRDANGDWQVCRQELVDGFDEEVTRPEAPVPMQALVYGGSR